MITKITPGTTLKPPSCQILGIRIHVTSLKKALSLLKKWVESNKQYQIVTPNPEQLVLAQEKKQFREVLNHADLAIPDGIGLIWAARIRGSSLKRLAGTDLMVAACQLAAEKGWRVFLLGGKDSAIAAAKSLSSRLKNKDFKIEADPGAADIARETSVEKKRIINKINTFKPHLLFVAYGAPHQELWIAQNLPHLKVKVAMGVGGAFDYLAGKVSRAPKIWRLLGLEWFFRLVQEPWRWRRQVNLLRFMWLVLRGT